MTRLLQLLSCLVALTGCPDYPCNPPEEGAERCDVGYACVKQKSILGEREVCKKVGALDIGEACTVAEECKGFSERTAVCADMHRRCPTGEEAECDLRCRPVCRFHDECGPDQICWTGGGDIPGVCQEGECGESRRECEGGLECLWFKPGATGGVCYAPCDLLKQAECNQTPPPADARCCGPGQACVHFANNPGAAACVASGQGTLNQACDTEESQGLPSCEEGMFCDDVFGCSSSSDCTGQCRQYCRKGGGAPACDTAAQDCMNLPTGDSLSWGYCE